MMYVGGLRSRLIRESVYQMLHGSLAELGWFETDRAHLPVTFSSTAVDVAEKVAKNTAALADWDVREQDDEMGSLLAETRQIYYVDFYAENDAIGLHFAQDVKDILGGRMSAIGRTAPIVRVYDWTQATPTLILVVQIENILIDRPDGGGQAWQKFMRSIRFEIVDHYATDADTSEYFDTPMTVFDDPDVEF